MTALEIAASIGAREVSVEEVALYFLERIGRLDGSLRSFIRTVPERAVAAAVALDRRLAGEVSARRAGGLFGVPFAVKDNICTRGIPTTCASRILESFVPPYDATVVRRMYEAGLVLLGKTNMDEFAMGSSCENSAFFETRNPWNLETVPGGSSGGSAAAVAAGLVPFALGSDTGGSVRQPAALCGIVGLKPTYGAVSRYGLVAFASSLDQIGPLTRDVADCAAVMNVIAGHDEMDSTSAPLPSRDYSARLGADIRGIRVGVPREYMGEGAEPGVRSCVRDALGVLEDLGAVVEECALPHTEYALSAYYLIAPAEASSNLARYDGVRYGLREDAAEVHQMYERTRRRGFGPEVKRRIMLGTYALSSGYYDAYYLKALKVRTLVKRDFDIAFEKYDVLVGPTSPTVAFPIGSKTGDPVKMYLSDVFSVPVNLAGVPAISVPCGLHDGLPVGLQMIGRPFEEDFLLMVAHAYEQAAGTSRLRPRMVSEG
ncbi:MAG: Asp-tRNA(Asn)/Glu-tRNA(Gln) amidotransferase subunit GatA [Firmicutes bacterium]|jgi:aspartyl-tRNA(Asn)/glutamyl-tRNA(Gln) amidotransferase subunit A|nr:Asp-tRNA(Asn)/Glu-tRNA(Gln) amidotransferase subunit GatA [Bacillota bacterium]